MGWFANPIFGSEGNYPQAMIEKIRQKSELQGFAVSRLPEFTEEEIRYIKDTFDFFGLNHYSSDMVAHLDEMDLSDISFASDKGTKTWTNENWPSSYVNWLYVSMFKCIIK